MIDKTGANLAGLQRINIGLKFSQAKQRIETQIGRWKAVIGPKLKAICFENQQTEVKISVTIMNKMIEFGRPVFEQIV